MIREGEGASEARLFGYAAGNFGKNLVWSSLDVTLLFVMTDLLGIAAGDAGMVMLLALAGDLVLDLLSGWFAAWCGRFGIGYRRIVALGALPGGVAFAMLYALPALGGRPYWLLVAMLLLFRGCYAIIDVPHNALLARIASDGRVRGRVSGYRLLFSASASILVAAVMTPAVQQSADAASLRHLAWLGGAAGALFVAMMLLAAIASPDAIAAERQKAPLLPRLDALFGAMAAIAFLTGFAAPMFERMLLYIASYVLDRPQLAREVLLAVTLGQFPGMLLWTALLRRYDKTVLLAAGHGLAVAGMLLFLLVGGRPVPAFACSLMIGAGLASVFMLPWGILADVVDFAQFRHGERRETGLFASFLVIIKASAAASSATIGWTMARLGYVPGAVQGFEVKAGILLLGIGVPVLGSLAAILLLSRLSIGDRRHRLVRTSLHRAERRRPLDSGVERVHWIDPGGGHARTEDQLDRRQPPTHRAGLIAEVV